MSVRTTTTLLLALALTLLLAVLAVQVPSATATPGTPVAADADPKTPPRAPDHTLPDDDRPNVVLILVDDMRTDEMRWMPQTRRLLSLRGTTFTQAMAQHPLCCPARATLATARYAQNHGVVSNGGPYGGFPSMRDPGDTVARWLDASGYLTALHGKYMNGYGSAYGAQPGWDVWDANVGEPTTYTTSTYFDGDVFVDDYVADRVTERSTTTLRDLARPGSPFFSWISYPTPHDLRVRTPAGVVTGPPIPHPKYAEVHADVAAPSLSAPSFNRIGNRRGTLTRAAVQNRFLARIRALQSVDDAVAEIVETLRQSGELDDTYVIFTSDNGYLLGEHGLLGKNVLYREALDIPLVVAGPGVKRGRSAVPVSLVDVATTIMRLGGVSAAERPADGLSMIPLLEGRPALWRNTTLVHTAARTGTVTNQGWAAHGVVTSRYLYVEGVSGRGIRLHDRAVDPFEMRNVAADPRYARIRRMLAQRLVLLRACSGAPSCNRAFGALPEPLPVRPPR